LNVFRNSIETIKKQRMTTFRPLNDYYMTKHSIENKAIIYTYSIIYTFSYKHYLTFKSIDESGLKSLFYFS